MVIPKSYYNRNPIIACIGDVNMNGVKGILIVVLIVLATVIGSVFGCIIFQDDGDNYSGTSDGNNQWEMANLETFESYEDIEDYLETNEELGNSVSFSNLDSSGLYVETADRDSHSGNVAMMDSAGDDDAGGSGGSSDYSKTNVQEEGVDEGDIVKNDGGYAYIVSKDRTKVIIVDVYPADESEIISEIEVDGSIIEIYLVGDKLVVLGRSGSSYGYYYDYYDSYYYSPSDAKIFVEVYDVEDREVPTLSRTDTMNGSYVSSRMIGNHFYLIGRQSTWDIENEKELAAAPSEIFSVDDYDRSYTYTNIFSIDIQNSLTRPNIKSVLMGATSEIYVSTSNIYITQSTILSWVEQKEMELKSVIIPILPTFAAYNVKDTMDSDLGRIEKMNKIDGIMGEYIGNISESEREDFYEKWQEEEDKFTEEIAEEWRRTAIYRIAIKKGSIAFQAKGDVPGYILNRFSMGEYNNHFRIATTTGQVWGWGVGTTKNHVFVLDMSLGITGSIRDVAPGESIYSARFMGSRAYLVTFEKVDPFFVMDLQDPYNPFILGELKIPGYSDYLHPYDANHVIGLGKETVLAEGGSFSWYQGVKLSLFDVTDVNNPKEISKYIIGDRGTYSPAQNDPHAFLFSLSKNLLVIPIRLYEIDHSKYPAGASDSTHGDFVWEGAYVFHVSADDGFELKGRITHYDDGEIQGDYWRYWDHDGSIKRSFYIEDVLYTVSDRLIMANDMDFLSEIARVELPVDDEDH